MSENDESGSEQTDPGVVARHIKERRAQLGLTEDDLATQACMSPRYLQHLLQMGLDFDPGGIRRIAAALGLTYEEMLEGRKDAPPGQTGPGPRPVLVRLSEAECWDKLGTHGVGRVALPVEPAPAMFPVNYAVDAGTIVYRTAPGGSTAPETGAAVSFEVDWMDDDLSQGWSVLVTGAAERVDDPAAERRLTERHAPEPWAGGDRPLWVRIRPDTVTGRRIATM